MQFHVRESGELFERFDCRSHIGEFFVACRRGGIDFEARFRDGFVLIFRPDGMKAGSGAEVCGEFPVVFDEGKPLFPAGVFQMADDVLGECIDSAG